MSSKQRPTPEPEALEHEPEAAATRPDAPLAELLALAEPQAPAEPHAVTEPNAEESAPRRARATSIFGVAIGLLAGMDEQGALVDFPDNPSDDPIQARATVPLTDGDVGREVALLFEGGDPSRPILVGLLHQPATVTAPVEEPAEVAETNTTASADGERLVFTADKEIVLRCGKASITLTRAGKILIRGAYVLARSSGVNRIQGGSVLIN